MSTKLNDVTTYSFKLSINDTIKRNYEFLSEQPIYIFSSLNFNLMLSFVQKITKWYTFIDSFVYLHNVTNKIINLNGLIISKVRIYFKSISLLFILYL